DGGGGEAVAARARGRGLEVEGAGQGQVVGRPGAAVGGEEVRLHRAGGGRGAGEVVGAADDAGGVGRGVVGVEAGVLVRGALGGLDVREVDARVLDRGPVDRALPVRDVDAGGVGLRRGRASHGHERGGERRGGEQDDHGPDAAAPWAVFFAYEVVHTKLPACQEICLSGEVR